MGGIGIVHGPMLHRFPVVGGLRGSRAAPRAPANRLQAPAPATGLMRPLRASANRQRSSRRRCVR